MNRFVRVVLSVAAGPFISGMNAARSAVQSFLGIFSSIGNIMTGIKSTIDLVTGAFRTMGNAVNSLYRTFLDGAIASERNAAALQSLVGNAEVATQIQDDLRDRILRYGLDAREAEFATNQLALALRGMNGEVDPDKLGELQDMMQQIVTIRPDIVGGTQAIGRGIASALAGDFSSLTKLIDLPLKKVQGLSAETQALLQGGEAVQEQTLGTVTRLGASTEQAGGDYIKALREILDAAGITSDLVDEVTNTTSGQLARLKANWQVFTDDVGKAFLPSLNEALSRFMEIIAEHRPEIDAFAESLGKWAGMNFEKLMDFLFEQDWEKIATDVARLGKEGFGSLAEFVKNVDWESIAKAIEAVANAINSVNEFITQSDPGALDKLFGQGGAIGTPGDVNKQINEMVGGVDPLNTGGKTGLELLSEWIAGLSKPQSVVVSVNDDGTLKAIVEETTDEKVSNLVKSTIKAE